VEIPMARTSVLVDACATEDAVGSPLFLGERSGFSKVLPPKSSHFLVHVCAVATMPKRVNTKLYIIYISCVYILKHIICAQVGWV